MPGVAGDFGGRHAGVQPQGYGGVPQVVGAARERGGVLGGGEGGGAGILPDGAVGTVLENAAAGGAEDPAAEGGAGRLRSEAAWAHLCGTAPIPASSGKVTRWRLNRGGDG